MNWSDDHHDRDIIITRSAHRFELYPLKLHLLTLANINILNIIFPWEVLVDEKENFRPSSSHCRSRNTMLVPPSSYFY